MFYMVSFLLPYTQDRAHHSSSEDFIKRPLKKKIPPTYYIPFSIDSKISSAMNMNLRFLGKLKKREKEKSQ